MLKKCLKILKFWFKNGKIRDILVFFMYFGENKMKKSKWQLEIGEISDISCLCRAIYEIMA